MKPLLFFITVAFSHPLDLGLLQFDGRKASLDLNPQFVADFLGLELLQVTTLTMGSRAEELMTKTLASGALARGGAECKWGKPSVEVLPLAVRLNAEADCPSQAPEIEWAFPFLTAKNVPSSFQVMVRAGEAVHIADVEKTALSFKLGEELGFLQFIWMGVEHIGVAPGEWTGPEGLHLPDGIDHILFIIALILGGGTLWELVKIATGFTVGHSITLALGALGVIQLPGKLVESLIALSIAFVALEALTKKGSRHRWKIATAFGLVHGLGLATAITELGLSKGSLVKALLGYNVGVEIGQIVVIALVAPLLAWLRAKPGPAGRVAVQCCAIVIFVAGSWWFVERAFL